MHKSINTNSKPHQDSQADAGGGSDTATESILPTEPNRIEIVSYVPNPDGRTAAEPDLSGDPTDDQFGAYRAAYDYFNERLFDAKLPRCLLNFSRKSKRTRGFFAPNRWECGNGRTHEISLNPDLLKREPRLVMSTLVHEMDHLWQEEFGTPSRSGYHNRQWADKMEQIGLMPSDTGEIGGKRTGQRMTHYIIPGGPFEAAFDAMPPEYLLPWTSGGSGRTAKPKVGSDKVRYSCPTCGANVWGKPGLRVDCGNCLVAFQT